MHAPTGAEPNVGDDETLPFVQSNPSGVLMDSGNLPARAPLGEATRFLNEQLRKTREAYTDKLRCNVELCGTVDELKEELEQAINSNHNVESALSKLQETQDAFLTRLSHVTGVEKSIVSLEDFVRASMNDLATLHSEMEKRDVEERSLNKRLANLLVQKRFLTHIIDIYQNKYKMNIFATQPTELQSAKRRLRVRLLAMFAASKLSLLPKVSASEVAVPDATRDYDMVQEVDITHVEADHVGLMEASLAVAAVPRLEKAIMEKDDEINKLESSLASLNRSAVQSDMAGGSMNDVPRSSYVYDEDVLNRKNDMSRRLQKVLKEKSEIESRLSREKQGRLFAEAKASKYSEKVSTYKRRLGKVSSHAESRESAYKAAIRYLKKKADRAVQSDFNMDENVAPTETFDGTEQGVGEDDMNTSTRDVLRSNLSHAEKTLAGMAVGSETHRDQHNYVNGLRRTIQRLESTPLFTSAPSAHSALRGAMLS